MIVRSVALAALLTASGCGRVAAEQESDASDAEAIGTDAGVVDLDTSNDGVAVCDDVVLDEADAPVGCAPIGMPYAWTPVAEPAGVVPYRLFVRARDDVWLAGSVAGFSATQWAIAHWDGHCWKTLPPSPLGVTEFWPRSESDVWILQSTGMFGNELWHYDGASWTRWSGLSPDQSVRWLWPLSRDDGAWAGVDVSAGPDVPFLLRWTGATWERREAPAGLSTSFVVGSTPDDLWLGGEALTGRGWFIVLHGDGTTWTPTTIRGGAIIGAAGCDFALATAPNDPWLSCGQLFHYDGTSWTQVSSPLPGAGGDLWGARPDDIWAGTGLHWDGASWRVVCPEPSRAAWIAGSASDDIWGLGADSLFHYGPLR